MGWYGYSKNFGTFAPDGPVLYGYGGGALGTRQSGTCKMALCWSSSGRVGIGTDNPQAALDVNGAVTAGALQVTNGVTAASLQVSGGVTAASLQVSGGVTAASLQLSGSATASSLDVANGVTASSLQVNGAVVAPTFRASGGAAYGTNAMALGHQCGADVNGVAMGYHCYAANGSFAAGRQATAIHEGSFVWNDDSDDSFGSWGANTVTMHASGGYLFCSGHGTGAFLLAGSGSWTSASDRNAKENITPVDAQAVLDKVAALPLSTWNYRSQAPSIRHMGPMAQDFMAAFTVGETNTGISTVDADGVALAAIPRIEPEGGIRKRRLARRECGVEGPPGETRTGRQRRILRRQVGFPRPPQGPIKRKNSLPLSSGRTTQFVPLALLTALVTAPH